MTRRLFCRWWRVSERRPEPVDQAQLGKHGETTLGVVDVNAPRKSTLPRAATAEARKQGWAIWALVRTRWLVKRIAWLRMRIICYGGGLRKIARRPVRRAFETVDWRSDGRCQCSRRTSIAA
jgi:hypothetical protein